MSKIEIDGRKNCLILPSGNVLDMELGEIVGKMKDGKFEAINKVEKPNCDEIIKRIRLKNNVDELGNTDACEEIIKGDKEHKEVIIDKMNTETKAEYDMYGRLKNRNYSR